MKTSELRYLWKERLDNDSYISSRSTIVMLLKWSQAIVQLQLVKITPAYDWSHWQHKANRRIERAYTFLKWKSLYWLQFYSRMRSRFIVILKSASGVTDKVATAPASHEHTFIQELRSCRVFDWNKLVLSKTTGLCWLVFCFPDCNKDWSGILRQVKNCLSCVNGK